MNAKRGMMNASYSFLQFIIHHSPFIIITALPALLIGCASLSGGQTSTVRCNFDTVWEESLMALESATLVTADKMAGVIETDWEKGMSKQGTGAFGRKLTQERSSLFVKIIDDHGVSTIRVIHVRQEHPLSGVRALRWFPVDGLPHVERRILSRIHQRLKKHGCHGA